MNKGKGGEGGREGAAPKTGPGSHKNWPLGYPEPAAVAKLLKTTPNMDKTKIGAFLSKGDWLES